MATATQNRYREIEHRTYAVYGPTDWLSACIFLDSARLHLANSRELSVDLFDAMSEINQARKTIAAGSELAEVA